MRVEPECAPCMLNRVIFQAKLVNGNCSMAVLKRAFADIDYAFHRSLNASECSTRVHANSYEEIGDNNPYFELVNSAYVMTESIMPFFNIYVKTSKDNLKAAFTASSVANVMDLGTYNAINKPSEFIDKLSSYLKEGFAIDDYPRIKNLIGKSRKVAFLFDNTGEDMVDTILIDELRREGCKVTGFVKRLNALNDTTYKLIRKHGIADHLDKVEVIEKYAIGLNEQVLTDEMREELKSCDLIISKGMANFEALSDVKEYGPIAFILRAKCEPIARKLSVPVGSNVLYLSE